MRDINDALRQPERLAAIAASDLLEGDAIPALDRVVRYTADLLDVPVVQLNVITADRQVPVSHVGGATWGRSVDLSHSYCQLAIRTAAPVVVENVRAAPELPATDALTDESAVAYLSVPIVSPRSTAPLATLCAVDFEPRSWTEREIAQLTDMSAWALSEIELRAGMRRDLADTSAALEQSEARYHALFNSIDEGFCVIEIEFDDDGNAVDYVFLETNAAFEKQTGMVDVVGRRMRELAPDHESHWFERYGHVARTGESIRFEEGARALGRWYDVYAFRTGNPEEGRVAVLFRDVADKHAVAQRQERLLEELEHARDRAERLQALTAALAGARTVDDVATVVVTDMVGALGARTGALAVRDPERGDGMLLLRTVGFPESVAKGVQRQPFDMKSPLTECFTMQAPVWIESREGPEGLDARYPPIAPVWDLLEVSSAAFVPLVAAGDTVGVISFAFATPRVFPEEDRGFLLALGRQAALAMERARLFDAEHQARADAERANSAKSEFLAVMSHELRTPLNAIGGYIELIDMGVHGPVTPKQHEAIARVQASQRHLLSLINEVLNYAKLETGTVHYQIGNVSIRDVLADAEALVKPQADAKALELVVTPCPPDVAARADAEKVRQVLVNLLSNAVKFTERGGRVDLSCAMSADMVSIVVSDTGIGIPADQLERIFDPFVQVRSDLTRTAEGTGLGLAISRDLARAMKGDLLAHSMPGHGSVFTLTLPAA